MEAILEAQARDTFGKNEARRTPPRRPGAGACSTASDGKDATPIAVEPQALLKILHSGIGRRTR